MDANDKTTFRKATRADLEAIVALLADDPIGRIRESPGPPLEDSDEPVQLRSPGLRARRTEGPGAGLALIPREGGGGI